MQPSSAEYWHIDETAMRLDSVTPPIWSGENSLDSIARYSISAPMDTLVGTWSLVRWTSGAVEPFGPDPRGTLVYTAGGTMIACFMRRERPPLGPAMDDYRGHRLGRSPDLPAPLDPNEIQRSFFESAMSFNAYSARYFVEGDLVHHDVEVAMLPDWIGRRLTRRFRIEKDLLTLSFESDELVWRRVKT